MDKILGIFFPEIYNFYRGLIKGRGIELGPILRSHSLIDRNEYRFSIKFRGQKLTFESEVEVIKKGRKRDDLIMGCAIRINKICPDLLEKEKKIVFFDYYNGKGSGISFLGFLLMLERKRRRVIKNNKGIKKYFSESAASSYTVLNESSRR